MPQPDIPPDPATLPYRPCVGVMLIDARGLIFAGRRRDTEAPAWQMPQGGVDPGEEPRQAALRELWEETGISADLVEEIAVAPEEVRYDLPPELLGKAWKGKYRGQSQHWYLYRFLGRDADVNIETEHPEFSEWRWISASDMLEAIVPFKRAVYDEVVSIFSDHLA